MNSPQQARVPLCLGDEQIEDFHEGLIVRRTGSGWRTARAQLRAIGTLAQLEGGDGVPQSAAVRDRVSVSSSVAGTCRGCAA